MTYTKEGIFISDLEDANGDTQDDSYASLSEYVFEKLDENSDLVLLVDVASGREWTGAKLKQAILNVASALIDQFGLKQGDVACVKHIHSDLKIIVSLALACAGAATGYVHYNDKCDELLRLARKVGLKLLFCQQNQLQMAEQLASEMGSEVVAIAMDTSRDLGETGSLNHIGKLMGYDYTRSKCFGSLPIKCRDISKDIAYFTTTSGTSGMPKMVPVTHLRFVKHSAQKRSKDQSSPLFCSTSFDYVSGYMTAARTFSNGYKWIISACVEPENLYKLIESYKIQELVLGVQALYSFIVHEGSTNYDLSSLKYLVPAGARVNFLSDFKQFCDKHPSVDAIPSVYGASECGLVSERLKTVDEYLHTSDSGKLSPLVRAKIVDLETGKSLGPGKQGMIHVKTPIQFPGYLDKRLVDNPDGPYLRDSTIFDQDGFYITGDIGYFDDNMYLTCLGRHSELMLVRDFWKVLPSELEAVLCEHVAVSGVCVLGVQHKINPTLHCPRAFVVINSTCNGTEDNDGNLSTQHIRSEQMELMEFRGVNKLSSLDEKDRHRLAKDIMEYFERRVSWQKQLTGGIVLLDQIPLLKTSGKMDKNYLRSLTLDEIETYGDRSDQ